MNGVAVGSAVSPEWFAWGVDPGLHGALAAVNASGDLVGVFDTPHYTVHRKGAKDRKLYDLDRMARIVAVLHTGRLVRRVGFELVYSRPGQGVRSMFSFGEGVGIWEGLLAAYGLTASRGLVDRVTPQRWKKDMLRGILTDKDSSRLRAVQLWPDKARLFSRKKDDGRAEAALLAEFARRQVTMESSIPDSS